ncbi:MAG: hypothetical protein MI919_08335, partial [Holophagales bacterium]|nr:hypothetical protein [Holophagales bacterium]
MSTFTTVCPDLGALDPTKRVKYSLGLVLGVDELVQEQLYFLEKDRRHQRVFHGYGTACGLGVTVESEESGASLVRVGAGLAVDPRGRQICVGVEQCARLEEWLARHRGDPELRALFEGGSPPPAGALLELYLVLCYRECETDRVPVPGGPCRSLDDASAPSRIADAFELRFAYEPPPQLE